MKLKTLLTADAVMVGGPGTKVYIHGGGIYRLTLDELPASHPEISAFVKLEREDSDAIGTDHAVSVRVLDPEGEVLGSVETNLRLPADADPDPPMPMYVNIVATFQGLRFTVPGVHRFVVFYDADEIGGEPLMIELKESAGEIAED